MTLYEDTKKSYYEILKRKLNEGNQQFSARIKGGRCYSGNSSKGHQRTHENYEKFVTAQNKVLAVSGNIIPIDESIFNNFPQKRPPTCVPLGTNVGKGNPNEWQRSWYWGEKQSDYNRIKNQIDEKLKVIKQQEDKKLKVIKQQEDKKIQAQEEQIKRSATITGVAVIGVLAYLLLKK